MSKHNLPAIKLINLQQSFKAYHDLVSEMCLFITQFLPKRDLRTNKPNVVIKENINKDMGRREK